MTIEEENEELKKRVEYLTRAIKKIKEIYERDHNFLIAVDIDDGKPHSAIRVYNLNGMACGFGNLKTNDSRDIDKNDSLFGHTGNVTYRSSINIQKLLQGDNNGKY